MFGRVVLVAVLALYAARQASSYRLRTAVDGLRRLSTLPRADVDACLAAYEYLSNGTSTLASTGPRDVAVETAHVRAYYAVANEVLAVADIEKMYIPPQVLPEEGLYANQLVWEERVFEALALRPGARRLLDVGCGRGRVAHHASTHLDADVDGFNVDAAQIEHAVRWANATGRSDRLRFRVGDHHQRFAWPDATFDGVYSFQAIWPFFRELDGVAKELFRVLKPGARYVGSEYLLTPNFDRRNPRHLELHRLFLPTLAATQSNTPADVEGALLRAGFEVLRSAPSDAPAWPLTDQKTDLFQNMRTVARGAHWLGLAPEWVEQLLSNFLKGGEAWAEAEKAKLADLNWQLVARKPERDV